MNDVFFDEMPIMIGGQRLGYSEMIEGTDAFIEAGNNRTSDEITALVDLARQASRALVSRYVFSLGTYVSNEKMSGMELIIDDCIPIEHREEFGTGELISPRVTKIFEHEGEGMIDIYINNCVMDIDDLSIEDLITISVYLEGM